MEQGDTYGYMEVEVDGRWEKGIGLVRMTEGNMFETVLKVKIELNLKSSLNNIYNCFFWVLSVHLLCLVYRLK